MEGERREGKVPLRKFTIKGLSEATSLLNKALAILENMELNV